MDMDTRQRESFDSDSASSSITGRKYLILFIFGVISAVLLFAAITSHLSRRIIGHHEALFQEQQALQVFLAGRAIEDQLNWMFSESNILAVHSLPEFAQGKRSMDSLRELFRTEQETYPDHIALLYMDSPEHVVNSRYSKSPAGRQAHEKALEWARIHWPRLMELKKGPLVPLIHVTEEFQILGVLFPVWVGDSFHGVLTIMVDLAPMIERYVVPMRSGRYGAGYLMDERGTVVFDHEREIVGRNVFEALHVGYPDLMRVDRRLIGESSGTDEYSFTVKRGGKVSRKLIAWNTVQAGDRRLVVCLSAPDMEINQTLYGLRMQRVAASVFISVILVLMCAVFFRYRQQLLESSNRLLEIRVGLQTEELLNKEMRYRTLFESANDAIFILDYDRFVDCNPMTLKMFGYEREKLVGMTPYDLSPELQPGGENSRELAFEKFERVLSGEPLFFIWRYLRKDGTLFDAEISLKRMGLPDERLVLAIIRDITERKKYEEEREKLICELKEALAEVKMLSGLLPICSFCKKVRDDRGYWQRIESYIESRSEAKFSHSMCTDCFKDNYPEFYDRMKEKGKINGT